MDRSAKDAELLLAHSEWVRRLARSLVRDPHSADDLVQRTWVAALERPPGDHVPLRAWFAGVLRNLARQDRRAEGRRTAREHAVARKDVLPPADESLDAIARQKTLMGAVLDLDEPYRSVIVRRYFDEKPPREIAEELGLPVKTVKTRLSRALEKLRERLDREHGSDRAAWMALFIPWLEAHGPAAAGGLLMDAKIKVAIATAIAAGTIAAVVHWSSPETPSEPSNSMTAAAPAALEAPETKIETVLVESNEAQGERAAVAAPVTKASPPAAGPAKADAHVRGRVIDITGAPVANLDVFGSATVPPSFRSTPALARTDSAGEFEFVKDRHVFQLAAENDLWTTAFHPRLEVVDREVRTLIVVAPRITIAGRVLDEARRPVAGADVWSSVDEKLRASIGQILDTSSGTVRDTKTDADGRFELGDVPACPGLLTVKATGFSLNSLSMPDHTTLDLEIVLRTPENSHAIVKGIVLEPDGRPADGALVSHGAAIETTDPDGKFEFDFALAIGGDAMVPGDLEGSWKPADNFRKIHAIKKGFAPAYEDLPPSRTLRESGKPHEITLMLGAKPLTIRGRVVDSQGKAVSGALVWIKDGTPFGSYIQKEGDMMMARETTVEDAFRAKLHTPEVIADDDGRFEIGDVLDREYVLLAMDSKTMRFGRQEHARADRAVEIVIPDDPSTQRVAGRIVAHGGRAIANVHIRLGRRSDSDSPPSFRQSRDSDAEGRFDFGHVSTDGLHFQLTSKEIAFVFDYEVPQDSQFSELEVPVSLQCHLQVDLGDRKDFADRFAVHDARGNELTMLNWRGSAASVEQRPFIQEGRSPVMAVEEIGREIVFYKGEVEVARMPLALKPGELTTFRP